MTKNDFINLLTQRCNSLDSFYSDCEKDTDVATYDSFDMALLKDSISRCKIFIHQIIEDVEQNDVPESFYGHLKQDIEHNLPTEIQINDIKKGARSVAVKIRNFESIANVINNIDGFIDTYSFYKQLGFAQKNTVLVGANGCGKTSLANLLKKTLYIQNGIVIPAQKLLIIPKFANTPNLSSVKSHFEQYQAEIFTDKVTFQPKEMGDFEYSITKKYGSEMVKLIGYLLGERQVRNNINIAKLKDHEEVKEIDYYCTLDEVIKIWNNLIEHRQLECDENNSFNIIGDGTKYDAHMMSDGERVIIYHASRVLLAPTDALIIIDEPETHLHKSIANKLWDYLENKRKDCTFIYFTHDLDFATSRTAQKGWIRDFKYPNHWDIDLLYENEIPEALLLKLLGSRKKILFCEGDTINSIDSRLYEILFPEYTIQPVETCKAVIAYTRAFNKIKNATAKAYGLIDRDFRSEDQLNKLESESIYSYSVAEVENLFLVEEFISSFAKYKHETINIDEIKNEIFKKIGADIEQQVSAYITNNINFIFNESHVKRADTKDQVVSNFNDFIANIHIEDLYKAHKEKLETAISKKNYNELIKIVNDKGLIGCVSKFFSYKKQRDYIEKALSYLKYEQEGRGILIPYFPPELQ